MANKIKNIKEMNAGNRGQNVIEYLLLTTAVVLVAIFIFNLRNGPMKKSLENVVADAVVDIKTLNKEIRF